MKRFPLILAGFLVGAVLALQVPSYAQSDDDEPAERSITVGGNAKITVDPDEALVRLGVRTLADRAVEAMDLNSQKMQRVLDALRGMGLGDDDLATSLIELYPRYDDRGEVVTGYDGADILSSIEYPYPVVPIVRHHHENWDGSGYPDGLRGSETPIGARILAVVDCYDALTSDRPYRPRLSHDAAMEIILQRRGVMYDPVVVDVFVRIQLESFVSARPEDSDSSLAAIAGVTQPSEYVANTRAVRLGEITASSEETLTLFEISRELSGLLAIGDVTAVIARHLRHVPFVTKDDFVIVVQIARQRFEKGSPIPGIHQILASAQQDEAGYVYVGLGHVRPA